MMMRSRFGGGGAGVGPSEARPSKASTSYSIPVYPQDIPYFEFGRLEQYRVPNVPVLDTQMGSLAHANAEEMGTFRVGEVVDLLRSYYNAWGLLTFAAPLPTEYMRMYQRRLVGDVSATYNPSRSRSRSVAPSHSMHGGAQHSARASRPPQTPRSRAVSEAAAEGEGEKEAKRPRTMDPPPQS